MLNSTDPGAIPEQFKHLQTFVDRVEEYSQFNDLVNRPPKDRDTRILAFYGPSGIGKTMLIDRLEWGCLQRGLAYARVGLDDGTHVEKIPFLKELARQLGSEVFAPWFERYDYWFGKAEIKITITADAPLSQTSLRDGYATGDLVAGNKLVFAGGQFNAVPPIALNKPEGEQALTETFLDVLGELVQRKPVVLLFEDIDGEDFPRVMRKWLVTHFLDPLRLMPGYGVLPILTMSEPPEFNPALDYVSAINELSQLSLADIVTYLRVLNIPESEVESNAKNCLQIRSGRPADVCAFARILVRNLKMRS